MVPTSMLRVRVISLLLLIAAPLNTAAASITDPPRLERTQGGDTDSFRPKRTQGGFTENPATSDRQTALGWPPLSGRSKARALTPNSKPKSSLKGLETPPKPQPQIMAPPNATEHLAAQMAPPGEADLCRGYYDVMGQYDFTFNCTKDDFIYCCGTCHYRFCCNDNNRRLNQDQCNNYNSPVWAKVSTTPPSSPDPGPGPGSIRLQQQGNNTVYVIGGVISFTVAVAVAIKVAFHKTSRQPRNNELNMPRALVDMLRHQSSPVEQGERNNSVALASSGGGEGTLGRPPKNLYPTLQNKDNRLGNLQHNYIHTSGSSPKHTATIERAPRMNNMQIATGGTLKPNKHNNTMITQPSFHHSLHNLAQLPPSYESAMKPELNRYSSLKRLEKDREDYSGYCTAKRRPNNAQPQPTFHSSQSHLQWGGDYTLGGRGTLPNRPRRHPQSAPTPTPNPYPLPLAPRAEYQYHNPNYDTLSKPPRRVKSTDQLLAMADAATLSRLSKNQQHQYYKAMAAATAAASAKNSNNHNTLRKSNDRMLMSPDHLEESMGPGGMGVSDYGGGGMGMSDYGGGSGMGGPDYGGGGGGGGMGVSDYGGAGGRVPTLPRINQQHQKAQSQQNVCATPSLDRHHMIKMNSHPTSGREREREREQERTTPTGSGHLGGSGGAGVGWGDMPGTGVVMGTGTLGGHSARRLAFAAKRQNTIEQLHFIPGGGGSGSGGAGSGSQGVRTGSKNEVTV
ncbi:protein shisa-7 [Clupea harengus]|uniref:Protein shisa-7 n=1 Tax=Clupea harengus TaxID=7950 RepID=A0A6P8FZC4_CLUHA|nr:protein shisa-7 [Clupea harengus]XP_031432179.1 protein shisa-7 [Clupea harengus]